jgi:hypothetical protein
MVLSSENAAAAAELKGIDSYELILNGQYILHKADVLIGSEKSETFEIIEIKGEETVASMHYYNSKSERGTMTGAIRENDFTIDSDNLKFQGKLNNDNTVITGKWMMKSQTGEWNDFIKLQLVKKL